jgi:hypothetical protein
LGDFVIGAGVELTISSNALLSLVAVIVVVLEIATGVGEALAAAEPP